MTLVAVADEHVDDVAVAGWAAGDALDAAGVLREGGPRGLLGVGAREVRPAEAAALPLWWGRPLRLRNLCRRRLDSIDRDLVVVGAQGQEDDDHERNRRQDCSSPNVAAAVGCRVRS